MALALQLLRTIADVRAAGDALLLTHDALAMAVLVFSCWMPSRRLCSDVATLLALAFYPAVLVIEAQFDRGPPIVAASSMAHELATLALLLMGGFRPLSVAALHVVYTFLAFAAAAPDETAAMQVFAGLAFLLSAGAADYQLAACCSEAALLAHVGCGLVSIDLETGRVTEADACAAEVFGVSAQSLKDRPACDFVPPHEHGALVGDLEALSTGSFEELCAILRESVALTDAPVTQRRTVMPFALSLSGRAARCLVIFQSAPPRYLQSGKEFGRASSASSLRLPMSPTAALIRSRLTSEPDARSCEKETQTWIKWEKDGFSCSRCAKPPRPKGASLLERSRATGGSSLRGRGGSSGGSSGDGGAQDILGGGSSPAARGGGDMRNMDQGSVGPCILPEFGQTKIECCWMSLLNSFKHWNVPQSMPVAQRDCCSLHSWLFCARKILKYVQKHQGCFNTLPYNGWQCQVCTAMNHQGSRMCGVCWRPEGSTGMHQPPGGGAQPGGGLPSAVTAATGSGDADVAVMPGLDPTAPSLRGDSSTGEPPDWSDAASSSGSSEASATSSACDSDAGRRSI